MSRPYLTTFGVLANSAASEALDLLVLGLETSYEAVALAAANALLSRPGIQGQREVLQRFTRLPVPVQQSLQSRAEQFDGVLRQLLLQGTPEQRLTGLAGVRNLHAADQIPQLIQLLTQSDLPDHDEITGCLEALVLLLEADVRGTGVADSLQIAAQGRRDRALMHLDQAILRYDALTARDVVVESILILGQAQHPAVKRVLWQASPDCRERAGRLLLTSRHPRIMRHVLDSLKQTYPHPKAFEAVRTRTDIEFLCELLRAVSVRTSTLLDQNLKQIDRFAWLDVSDPPFSLIPPALQPALLTLVLGSRVTTEQKMLTQDWLLRHGGPAGRMAAAEKAALMDENVIQTVLVDSLDAEDEHVQAWAVTQLRQHAVPETFSLLLERLDSPFAEVREAVREELSDFNLDRVLGMLDTMEPPAAIRVGMLLAKLDSQAFVRLERELQSAIRPKRIRAAMAIVKLGYQQQLLAPLLKMAQDSDFMIRRTVAETLESFSAPEVLPVLDRLAIDPHPRVREAAVRSLASWKKRSEDQLDPVLVM